jgi:hypothetical protein
MVSFLIDEDQVGWDADRVRAAFGDGIAEKILQMPISRQGGEDFVLWPSTKFGTYTVKSGYNLARSRDFMLHQSTTGAGNRSDRADVAKGWKTLWRIRAPGKMKIVLWRFAMTVFLLLNNFDTVILNARTCASSAIRRRRWSMSFSSISMPGRFGRS